jgi:hypothetical protein
VRRFVRRLEGLHGEVALGWWSREDGTRIFLTQALACSAQHFARWKSACLEATVGLWPTMRWRSSIE